MGFIQKLFKIVLVVVILGGLAAWRSGYNPLEKAGEIGEQVTRDQLSELKQLESNSGKRVSITGYGDIPGYLVQFSPGMPADFTFNDLNGNFIEQFPVKFGGTWKFFGVTDTKIPMKNSWVVPDNFTEADLRVIDNDGVAHGIEQPITISFTLVSSRGFDVSKQQGKEFGWKYKNIRIDAAH